MRGDRISSTCSLDAHARRVGVHGREFISCSRAAINYFVSSVRGRSADLNENEYSYGYFGVHGESREVPLSQIDEDTGGAASFISYVVASRTLP